MKTVLSLLVAAVILTACAAAHRQSRSTARFSVVEATIPDMQKAMQEGRVTSRQLVEQYLQRIALYNDKINAVITVNPRALDEADRFDRERRSGKLRGPLHGIPVALKDNILTAGLRTTGGAIAFEDLVPPYDATLTRNLVDAGAVIIAKTTLTELANFVTNGMPGNYNAVQGYALNPYDPRRDPRPGGGGGPPGQQTRGRRGGGGPPPPIGGGELGGEQGAGKQRA
ncbi:MAG: amidase family protein, partial [Steroidobacteraceae bacterium]